MFTIIQMGTVGIESAQLIPYFLIFIIAANTGGGKTPRASGAMNSEPIHALLRLVRGVLAGGAPKGGVFELR